MPLSSHAEYHEKIEATATDFDKQLREVVVLVCAGRMRVHAKAISTKTEQSSSG